MARYRKIDVRIWDDQKFRSLTRMEPSGQALWLYLLTNRYTTSVPGIFAARKAAMADELKWSGERFDESFSELFSQGMANADWDAGVVWLPNAFRYNTPPNPNVVRGWVQCLDEIPECELKTEAVRSLISQVERLGKPYAKPLREWFGKPFRHGSPKQDQDQDQDQESESGEPLPGSPPDDSLLVFACRGESKTWRLTQSHLDSLLADFPGMDVLGEIRKAHAWTEANVSRRKTAKGMAAFVANWLARATDRQGGLALPRIATAPSSTPRLMTAHD